MVVATVLISLTAPLTWRLVWPPFKRLGKPVFYVGVSALLAWLWGWWSLLYIVLHPLWGLVFHVWWCKRHGLSVWRPDPEAYVASQKAWVASLQRRAKKNQP